MSRSPDIAISRLVPLVVALVLAVSAAPAWPQLGEPTGPYVRFAQITVPIIQGDKVTKETGVVLTLELFDGKLRGEVEAKRPLLTDAFVKYLYGYFQQRAGLKTPLNEAVLKDRLRQTAAAIVGPDVVKEVLIQQLFER